MTEAFTFFWKGPFSQWHGCKFTDGVATYNCAEQYMMAKKALLFQDIDSFNLVMASASPREQKALGRKVRGFDVHIWNRVARSIVYQGNYYKFLQNDDLLVNLIETTGTTLVEASPVDQIWGIGLTEDNPLAQSRDTWKGLNWLGEVLTNLRDDLIAGTR